LAQIVEKRTAAEQVYRALKRDIITLRHRPGVSLTEHQLAELYARRAGGWTRRDFSPGDRIGVIR